MTIGPVWQLPSAAGETTETAWTMQAVSAGCTVGIDRAESP
jgi:hypothetical protein